MYISRNRSLIFMGSEKYPFKGTLGQVANRAFSSGANASTATDNTSYTVSTAGEQGFLQLLPVYVDHILYPTLTEAAFLTEVSDRGASLYPSIDVTNQIHHVDGEGKDSGVVYCEMQGCDNTLWHAYVHFPAIWFLRPLHLSSQPGTAYGCTRERIPQRYWRTCYGNPRTYPRAQ